MVKVMDALIKAECNKLMEKVEKEFYEKARLLQRDIIKATSKKYGFEESKALKDYGLEEVLEEEEYGSLDDKETTTKEVKKEVKKKEVKKKDPDAPKRPTTSYAYFIKEKHSEVAKEFPTEVKKKLGEMWKGIKDTPDAKPYKDLNLKDKVRYEEEMSLYIVS